MTEHGNDLFSRKLMRFDLATRETTELKRADPGSTFTSYAVSPDGAQAAYLLYHDSTRTTSLEVMQTADGASREVFRATPWLDGTRRSGIAWTPDQRYLFFVRTENGQTNTPQLLWRVSVRGGAPENTGISAIRLNVPRVDPSGRRITFQAGANVPNEVWVLENFLPALKASR